MGPFTREVLTHTTFALLRTQVWAAERLGLPAISTGRPFAFYRRVFFDDRPSEAVLDELEGKVVADIGCGLTPYVPNSMFQACWRAGVAFYGVDPKLGKGFRLGAFDRLKAAISRGGRPDPSAPGADRRIAARADALPFDAGSLDLILSSWLAFVWVADEAALARVFGEWHRVLAPGGEARVYPTPRWTDAQTRALLCERETPWFDVQQEFVWSADVANLAPAYVTTFRRR